ncbi:MAG TPA: DMT family transporter [Azospirillum sp.]|nr:DMT family transporter [Azospirillum sp.]
MAEVAELDVERERPLYQTVGLLLGVAGVLAFSLRPVIIKTAYTYGVDAVTLITLRMVFSLPFFVGMAVWSGRGGGRARLSTRDWMLTLGLGALGYYVASFLDFLGLQYVSAGVGRLLLFLYPTIVVVLSALFLAKPIGVREVVSLAVSYVGVALVLSTELAVGGAAFGWGAFLVFGSAVCYAVYLVAGSRVIARVGSMRFTAYAMIAASVCCIVQFLALRPLSALNQPAEVYGLSIVMAVFCTVLPVFMTAEALRRIGANTVALVGALGPVSAAGFGYLALGEQISWMQFAGAALVMVGVLIISVKTKR